MYNQLEQLKRQRDNIDSLINSYQNPPQQPVNNFINTNQPQQVPNNLVELRVLNENEEVDNLYVKNKTLFIGDKTMAIKNTDGKIEKWEIKKTYPIDPKDAKIDELERQILELKGMIANEYSKRNQANDVVNKSDSTINEYDESTAKANSKPISKETK